MLDRSFLSVPSFGSLVRGPGHFGCGLRHNGRDAAWIALEGELDFTGAEVLDRCVDDALASAILIVLDPRQLAFMDTTGVHSILRAERRARRTERRLRLIRGCAQTSRLLELTGLNEKVEVVQLPPSLHTHGSCVLPGWADAT